ncbi:hypothetical protein SAMN05421869_15034 [Nonomuraea jiangxiensis]|uniref:Uncharacterized protein n=2 Tax=Nonomuraea jiangxiensis TaxID=633440 RepID=A0A1G9UWP4_9ACTN|nr:hypothetical protein SAMN05421869_15034 [Nonomuraea jiangxiensis]
MSPGSWRPADERPSFFAHALTMSARFGSSPWPADDLPDEPPRPSGLFISSTVMDGIRSHHSEPHSDSDTVEEAARLLQALAEAPAPELMSGLHDRLAESEALAVADDLLDELARRRLREDRLRAIGRDLAEYGTRREATKIGIALVGACGDERDRDLLLLLGSLEEFTLYAVVALLRSQPDGHRAVYELARRVGGWGRIHAVERLHDCDDPEIKDWVLREGWRNSIMDEYLAPIAATTGGLYAALLVPAPDDGLVTAAGGVLATLVQGESGPSTGISGYADAVPALSRFAELAAGREATLGLVNNVLTIRAYLRDGDPGWPRKDVRALRHRYDRLAARDDWRAIVLAGLAEPGTGTFRAALSAAERLALPAIPQVIAHLRAEPGDNYCWYTALRIADAAQAAQVVETALELLPVDDLATGPGTDQGFGPEYEAELLLETVVDGLGSRPGLGLPLIRAALRNRVVRLRWCALRALAAWPAMPDEVLGWIREAADAEPDPDLREELRALAATGTGRKRRVSG